MVRVGGSNRGWAIAAVVFALGAVSLVQVADAGALTRKQANRVALRALTPERRAGDVVVFGLRKALGPRRYVYEDGLRVSKASRKRRGVIKGYRRVRGYRTRMRVRPLGRRSWLYVMDLVWQARFQHPMVMALVDDRTGRVRKKRILWPVAINGRPAPFFRTTKAYLGRRFRVYTPARRRAARASASGLGRSSLTEPRLLAGPGPLRATASGTPSDDFANAVRGGFLGWRPECMLVGGRPADANAMERWAKRTHPAGFETLHLPVANANRNMAGSAPTGQSLEGFLVSHTSLHRCKDVLIYLSGGGHRKGTPTIVTGKREKFVKSKKPPFYEVHSVNAEVTAYDLRRLVRRFRKADKKINNRLGRTFKFKLDAPYSARFIPFLKDEPNVKIIETSSRANEPAYPQMAGHWTQDGKFIRNPHAGTVVSQFTQQNLIGLQRFANDRDEVDAMLDSRRSPLAWALARAAELGADRNFALTQGLQHPQVHVQFPVPAPPPPPPAPQLEGGGNFQFVNPGDPSQGIGGQFQFSQSIDGVRFRFGSHSITNFAPGPGAPFDPVNDCAIDTDNGPPNNRLTCTGPTVAANTPFNFAFETNPDPGVNIDVDLFGREDGQLLFEGPFPTSGP